MIKVLYTNDYAHNIPKEVSMRELHKFDYEKLRDQAVQAYTSSISSQSSTSNAEIQNLKMEVAQLKEFNKELTEYKSENKTSFLDFSGMNYGSHFL